jgi:hypothetical protein
MPRVWSGVVDLGVVSAELAVPCRCRRRRPAFLAAVALADCFGVGGGSVAADDLDAWVLAQPLGVGGGVAVGQHVDPPVGDRVDDDAAAGYGEIGWEVEWLSPH